MKAFQFYCVHDIHKRINIGLRLVHTASEPDPPIPVAVFRNVGTPMLYYPRSSHMIIQINESCTTNKMLHFQKMPYQFF